MTINVLPPLDYLRQQLRYEPETGKLFWLERPRSAFETERGWKIFNTSWAGREAGCRRYDGVTMHLDRVNYRAHRIIFYMHHGRVPEGEIDHIDGDPLNNRIENLREVSHQANARNRARNYDANNPAFGVYAGKSGGWFAQIKTDGRHISLGTYNSLNEAMAARMGAERALGFHHNHGRASTRRRVG